MPTDDLVHEYDDQTLSPTPVEAWGSAAPLDPGFVATLPSGNIVRMRRTLDLPVLLKTGKIPNPLAPIIQRMMDEQLTEFPPEANNRQVMEQLLELLDATVVECFIEPKVSRPLPKGEDPKIGPKETDEQFNARMQNWSPEPGTLSIFQIEPLDKMYVWQIAQGAAASLARFLSSTASSVGDLQDGPHVPGKAVGTDGAPGNRQQRRAAAKKQQPRKSAAAKKRT